MCRCKTRSFFPFCHSFFSCFVLSCRYRSITFFLLLLLFSFAFLLAFSSRVFFPDSTQSYDRKRSAWHCDVQYVYMHGLVPFLFSSWIVSLVLVQWLMDARSHKSNRRSAVFSSSLFFSLLADKVHLCPENFLLTFSLSLVLFQWLWVCRMKRGEEARERVGQEALEKFQVLWWCNYNFSILPSSISEINLCVHRIYT